MTTEINQDADVTLPSPGDTTELKDEGIAYRGPAQIQFWNAHIKH